MRTDGIEVAIVRERVIPNNEGMNGNEQFTKVLNLARQTSCTDIAICFPTLEVSSCGNKGQAKEQRKERA